MADDLDDPLLAAHLSQFFPLLHAILRIVTPLPILATIRIAGQEWILLPILSVLATLSNLSAFLKLPALTEVASQLVKSGLIAVLEEGLRHIDLSGQDVVDRRLNPVVDDHLKLYVHFSEAFVLLILAKVILASLNASSFLRGGRLATLSHQNWLQICVLFSVTCSQASRVDS